MHYSLTDPGDGWDVVLGDERIQVRGVWHASHRRRGSIGAVPQQCDSIVAVEFGLDLGLKAAWKLTDLPVAGTRLQVGHVRRGGTPIDLGQAAGQLGLLD